MIACLLAAGCARYEYAIIQPPELEQHVGREETVIDQPPLYYRLVSYENRLVMHIANASDQPVRLIGDRSWIVTPDGESRPLISQTIAPQSHIKFILPPIPVRAVRTGPSIGIGFGVSSGGVGTGAGVGMPLRSQTYIREEDTSWDWDADTDVRMHLEFEHNGETLTRDFTFLRKKV